MKKIFYLEEKPIPRDTKAAKPTKDELEKFSLFVQYRGKASEHYGKDLRRINAPPHVG